MLELATREQFEPLLHQRFLWHLSADRTFEVELIEIEALKANSLRTGELRRAEPFSLTFRGPREFYGPQGLFTRENQTLGKKELFLVPIGPDEVGHRYQAIFN